MNCPTCNKYNNPDITYDRVRKAIGDKAIVKLTIAGKESVFDLSGYVATLIYDEMENETVTVVDSKPPDTPFLAIGNSEPIPENLPQELKDIIRKGRTKAGYDDNGDKTPDTKQSSSDPLDKILKLYLDPLPEGYSLSKQALNDLLQRIVEEVIGEDDPNIHNILGIENQNNLREFQRKKANELLGGRDE